jgi:hypothetical protein
VPVAMAGPAPVEVEGWYQALEKSEAMETLEIAIHVMHKHLEELPSLVHGDGNQGESRGGGAARGDAIISVSTRSLTFPVAMVDITAPLTSTSRCDTGTGRPVPCSTLASLIPPTCAYGTTSTVLYQGPITLALRPLGARSTPAGWECRKSASHFSGTTE